MLSLLKTAMNIIAGASPFAESSPDPASINANESNEDLQREAERSGTKRAKRAREESGSPELQRKVARRLGQHEGRLTEHYSPRPPDAITISVPTTHDNDWNPDHGSKMARGVQPSNTLNQPTVQSSGSGNGSTFFGCHAGRGPAALATQTVRGDNVQSRVDAETRFNRHQDGEPKTKKQRTTTVGGTPGSSLTVDLTDDGSMDFDVFAAHPFHKSSAGPMSMQPARSSQPAQANDHFAARESHQAASFTTEAKQSKSAKRRSNDLARNGSERSSVYASARSPAIEIQDSSTEDLPGARHSPVVVWEGSNGNAAHPRGSRRVPPIELSKGLPNPPKAKAKAKASQGSEKDLQVANSMLQTTRPTNKPPRQTNRAQPQEAAENTRQPPNLRHTFKRDDHTHGHPLKAKDRMRADSRNDRNSPDQIAGDRTIPSYSSPHKEKLPQSSVQSNTAQQQKSSSAVVHQQKYAGSTASECPIDDILGTERIPIRSIFSKQYVGEQGDLALEWSDEENAFFVVCGQDFVRLPHQTKLVTIGKNDVSHSWQHSRDLAKAMLKGSSVDCSNGTAIIEFVDDHGLNACYNLLMHATGDGMTSISASAEHMEKCFVTQSKALREANKRLRQSANNSYAIAPDSRRAGYEAMQDHSEEDIVYEKSDDLTLSGVVPQKRTARVGEEISPWFTRDNNRRSTRQVKPTIAHLRTPTPPPRWSEINPPVEWQQPVVYPSQGARRVTVNDSDISRLDEGEYLNDNLLGFAIRHIEETMDPQHKLKVHFFNTFFYSALMKNRRGMDYDAVKRWTKNVDIFTIPYTVVPINHDLHWYFAIICNMQFLDRKLSGAAEQNENIQDTRSSVIDVEELNDDAPPTSAGDEREIFTMTDDGHVVGSAATSSHASTANSRRIKKKTAPTRKYDTNAPVIIMLDSFGHARPAEISTLKKYIQAEAKDKREMDVDIGQIQGLNAKGIPEQPNFCDCGVFVIGILRHFARDPDTFVRKLLRREMDPDKDFPNFSAPAIRNSIRRDLLKTADEQAEERRVLKAQKKTKLASTNTPSSKSKPASPVSQLQTAHKTSAATLRSTSIPAPSAPKFHPSSPAPTSQTALREQSTPHLAIPKRTADNDDDQDELEVSPPVGLKKAGNASLTHRSASSASSDSDDEMLEAPKLANGYLSSNSFTQKPSSSAISASTALGTGASQAGSNTGYEARDGDTEIPDSQGRGY